MRAMKVIIKMMYLILRKRQKVNMIPNHFTATTPSYGLKYVILHLEQLLLENNLVARKSLKIISHNANGRRIILV